MTVERNFRQEAQSARQSARETLLAYRQARLRSKQPAKDGAAGKRDSGKAKDGALIHPEAFFSMARPASVAVQPEAVTEEAAVLDHDAASLEPEDSAEEVADAPASEEDAGAMASEEAEQLVETEDHELEKAASGTAPVDSYSVSDVDLPPSPDTPDPTEQRQPEAGLATVDANSDLFELPGAGAGMIWMFHQCGINSLADLAKADARELSLGLGVVGHILNVEPWIAFARERQSGNT